MTDPCLVNGEPHRNPAITRGFSPEARGSLLCNACWVEIPQPRTWRAPATTYSWVEMERTLWKGSGKRGE